MSTLPAIFLGHGSPMNAINDSSRFNRGFLATAAGWCPKMYADKRRANKKQRRHGIFELCKFKLPFAVPVAVGRI